MRILLQQTKDTIAIIIFSIFPIFILVLPPPDTWPYVVAFLITGAFVDTCFVLFNCRAHDMYVSDVKDGFGASGLTIISVIAAISGPVLMARTAMCFFFALAFVIDSICLVSAAGECYNIYTHRLKPPLRVDTPVHVL